MRDRAAGDVLYLIVEHLYGWFSLDDEISDEDADRDEGPLQLSGTQVAAQQIAYRGKADIDPGQERIRPMMV